MPLHHLVYFSRLLEPSLEAFKKLEIQARSNNERDKVSGFLVIAGGYAFQVLEGRRDQLSKTFVRIAQDPRHTDVTVTLAEDISTRFFQPTPMMLIEAMEYCPEIMESYLVGGIVDPAAMSGPTIWDMLRSVADKADAIDCDPSGDLAQVTLN